MADATAQRGWKCGCSILASHHHYHLLLLPKDDMDDLKKSISTLTGKISHFSVILCIRNLNGDAGKSLVRKTVVDLNPCLLVRKESLREIAYREFLLWSAWKTLNWKSETHHKYHSRKGHLSHPSS